MKFKKQWKSIALFAFLVVVVITGIWYVKKPQDTRNRAALTGPTLSFKTPAVSQPSGKTFPLTVILNASSDTVTAAQLEVVYNPSQMEFTAFTPGTRLPVILTPVKLEPGRATVTLGANPNAYLIGTDIIGTFTVKSLTSNPATISFNDGSQIASLGKDANSLAQATSITINRATSTTPSPTCTNPPPECVDRAGNLSLCDPRPGVTWCRPMPTDCTNAQNGASCTTRFCPTMPPCQSGFACTQMMPACRLESGTCQNGSCSVCLPRPDCWDNPPIVNGVPVRCSVPPPPNGMTYCPPASPTPYACSGPDGSTCTAGVCPPEPTCAPNTKCLRMGMMCKLQTGVCKTGRCIVTATPTPPTGCFYKQVQCFRAPCDPILVCPTTTVTPVCVRNKPAVSIAPASQSGRPGATLAYNITFTNNDSRDCAPSDFSITPLVSDGWTQNLTNTTVPNVYPGQGAGVNYNVTSATGITTTMTAPVSATVTNKSSSLSARADASYTVVPAPVTSQSLEFRVKLTGVTNNAAEGAKMTVRFVKSDGTSVTLNPALILSHIGGGVYKATATLATPLAAGTRYTARVKAEKHVAVKFCKITGQTGACPGEEFITVPSVVPATLSFDFTGIALPPGDLPVQDGVVDAKDFQKLKDLMGKLHSALTAADLQVADLNYDGWINSSDAYYLGQTLSIRNDE